MEKRTDFFDAIDKIQRQDRYIEYIEEENRKLKSDLSECKCSMHFENDEVWYRKRECKKLKAELSKYKKLHKYSNWELLTYKGGELMEEDTLQELRDIGEI